MFFSKFNINELYKEKWFVERLSTNRFVYSLKGHKHHLCPFSLYKKQCTKKYYLFSRLRHM